MRVLLVEDDSATAHSIELMLKSESFNVYTTDLGEEGVDLGDASSQARRFGSRFRMLLTLKLAIFIREASARRPVLQQDQALEQRGAGTAGTRVFLRPLPSTHTQDGQAPTSPSLRLAVPAHHRSPRGILLCYR
jgi:hypothetical protein